MSAANDFREAKTQKGSATIDKIATYSGTRQLIAKYGITAKKNYGQNFLIDTHVLNKIITASGITSEHLVIEIGPGIGGLTQAMAEYAGKVVAIETDAKLIPVLNDIFSGYSNVEIIHADILKTDVLKIINDNPGLRAIAVANLPYYITTPIIMDILEKKLPFESVTFMVQKEVANRMKAQPGNKDYGALSLVVQYYAKAYLAANVPPNSFIPRPGVDSAVLQLTPLSTPAVEVQDEKLLFRIIKAAFGHRRKTLLNCLYSTNEWTMSKDELADALRYNGFPADVRGEALSLEDFGKLAEYFYSRHLL